MKGYRTYVVAALIAIFGALSALDWNFVLNDPKAGASLIISSILMALMRSITTSGPGEKYAHPAAIFAALVLTVSLAGCYDKSRPFLQMGAVLSVQLACSELEDRYAKLEKPSALQRGLMAAARKECANPAAVAADIVKLADVLAGA